MIATFLSSSPALWGSLLQLTMFWLLNSFHLPLKHPLPIRVSLFHRGESKWIAMLRSACRFQTLNSPSFYLASSASLFLMSLAPHPLISSPSLSLSLFLFYPEAILLLVVNPTCKVAVLDFSCYPLCNYHFPGALPVYQVFRFEKRLACRLGVSKVTIEPLNNCDSCGWGL